MKPINTLLLSLTILIFASCSVSGNSNQVDCDRDDVLGTWEITMASFKKMRKDKPANDIITSFHLNADSTFDLHYGDKDETTIKGKWAWQTENELHNDKSDTSLKHGVILRTPNIELDMLLKKTNRKLCLSVSNYSFTKKQKARR